MLSSVVELARWMRAVTECEVISKQSYAQMMPGLQGPENAKRTWIAAGGNGIFNTIVTYNPARRLVVVAASMDGRLEIEGQRWLLSAIYKLIPAP
jgi:hypothetical protein